MKHLFTLGIIVLTGQLGFAGAFFLKFFIREGAHPPVDDGVRGDGFCEDDGNPRPPFLRSKSGFSFSQTPIPILALIESHRPKLNQSLYSFFVFKYNSWLETPLSLRKACRLAGWHRSKPQTARCCFTSSPRNEGGRVIEVEQLTKRYGSVKAIDSVSFRVEKGEIWASSAPTAPARPRRCVFSLVFFQPLKGRRASQVLMSSTSQWKSSAGSVICRRIHPSTTK